MTPQPLYDLAPLARIALLGAALALGPLAWVMFRSRRAQGAGKLHALTVLTLFLTFDLVLFGAFTRLTDSGLGCPDWPGCYGSASPLGAQHQIQAAETAMPSGAVTHSKAWVEMTHRYLATAVGALIAVLALARWREWRRDRFEPTPWWAAATLIWVCLQGAFGALTVTMKLYPAIVTAHLLGGLGLLALLAVQVQRGARRPAVSMSFGLHIGTLAVAGLSLAQLALGGWVSTNYAVLACSDFPTCQGRWWPAMDFARGFAVVRELGAAHDGGYLPFAALTAIHYAHRLSAYVVLAALTLLAWRLRASGDPALRPWAMGLAGVALWQLASGLSNVVLGWPLLAAVAHTGGAAMLVVLLTSLLASAQRQPAPARALHVGGRPAGATS